MRQIHANLMNSTTAQQQCYGRSEFLVQWLTLVFANAIILAFDSHYNIINITSHQNLQIENILPEFKPSDGLHIVTT